MIVKQWLQRLTDKERPSSSNEVVKAASKKEPNQLVTAVVTDRDMGDRARDSKNWEQAASFYESHLRTTSDDAAIWVQLGHSRKETGDYKGAEKAYQAAFALTPDDADIPLQLGHSMKLSGRTRDAAELYSTSLRLRPNSNAYRELVGMGQAGRADQLVGNVAVGGTSPTIFLQINDLLHFLRVNKTPSGIQRVQLGILTYWLTEQSTVDGMRVEFVFNQPDDTRVWMAARSKLQRLVDYLDQLDIDQIFLRRIVDDVLEDALLVKPGKGDSFVILGAFWGMPGNTQLMASLRAQGASLGIYIYDLIPITFPEYCAHQLTVEFTLDLCEALQLIDFVLAISDYTAREIRDFITVHDFPMVPIQAVPLAHSLTGTQTFVDTKSDFIGDWTDSTEKLRGRDFVLCVCTIEPRKNHKYLFDAWKIMKQEGTLVPDLVFVGRKGWYVNDFLVQLENSDYLDGSITVVHDLSDTELATLYRACRFTVFPSIVEGWGLPLGESLTFGKLCVSSNTSSMPEVGQNLVAYIDPLNLRSGIETLRNLIIHPNEVIAWERRIKAEFQPRSWNDVSKQLLSTISRLHAE